jgi:HD-like signal output (HDOD) protein
MLGDLFKRFRSPAPAPVAAAERPAAATVPEAARPTSGAGPAPAGAGQTRTAADAVGAPPSVGSARDVRQTPDADAREMQQWLELDVRTRVAELHNVLGRQDRASDAPRFLDSLLESFEAVVRQPPLAAQRALSISRDPNAAASRLVSLVEGDPGLGQALLRYANSAYYATGGGRVVSLHGAVQRVGTSGVHNVVLKTMVDGMLCRPGSAYQELVNLTWQHMVRVAPIARSLAPAFGGSSDEAYALGLLHDVGKLVIFDRLGELRATLRRDVAFPRPILSVVLRSLHEPLGALAALQWGLGAGVAHAIGGHHRSPVPEIHDPRCELLFVSERVDLARARGAEIDLDAWWRDGILLTSREAVSLAMARVLQELEAAASG